MTTSLNDSGGCEARFCQNIFAVVGCSRPRLRTSMREKRWYRPTDVPEETCQRFGSLRASYLRDSSISKKEKVTCVMVIATRSQKSPLRNLIEEAIEKDATN